MWGGFGRLVFIGSGLVSSCCWTSEVVEERGALMMYCIWCQRSPVTCFFCLLYVFATFPPAPSAAYIHSNQIMGWGEKAIEIRSVETGHLDGVFMHKRAQRLKFLCERNDKVRLFNILIL